ncbi:rhamnogalacturonan acetylesterase [Paenibacillus sp. JX-17]|uniref:Rhamnogalacturonan acetylesterase n=1 Tax=Paenibacillus lacisoli TaxID=3064525 RepID=A0ABT9C8I3_9BACL|nr:rhamnogalacturonan acetylesterase [Paenibacillus sp. JX-17]MDO7905549.1 rhamnogalacturonan acetylesterase [Paenibacillus sp. JX-17]
MNRTIYIAGDSTAAPKSGDQKPMAGWGEYIPLFFSPQLNFSNWAINGRSTKSFIDQGRLSAMLDQFHPGDYLIIQFGHNDGKIDDPERYTNPHTDFKRNLSLFTVSARSRGVLPVLLTPVSRRRFLVDGSPDPLAVGEYPAAVKEAAAETGTPLLDLFSLTQKLYGSLGIRDSAKLFLHLPAGRHPNYPDGVEDDTHFNERGARLVAEQVAEAVGNCAALTSLHPWLRLTRT